MKRWIYFLFLFLGWVIPAQALEVPDLYEFEIEGTPELPTLLTPAIKLVINREYVFVLNNPHPISLVYQFDNFAQHITTRYLQGSPSVTRESISILPASKLMWHFVTVKPGKFYLQVVHPATLAKTQKCEITIVENSIEETLLENKTEKLPIMKR